MQQKGGADMVNTDRLVGLIYEKGMNKSSFARKLGKHSSWLSNKLKNKNFTIEDADEIVSVLNLNEAEATSIFFSQFVA
jgi:hypothetical protein